MTRTWRGGPGPASGESLPAVGTSNQGGCRLLDGSARPRHLLRLASFANQLRSAETPDSGGVLDCKLRLLDLALPVRTNRHTKAGTRHPCARYKTHQYMHATIGDRRLPAAADRPVCAGTVHAIVSYTLLSGKLCLFFSFIFLRVLFFSLG